MTDRSPERGSAWHPTHILWVSLFLSAASGFVLHTLNYRKLGMEEEFRRALLRNGAGGLLLLAVLIGDVGNRLFLLVLNAGFAIYFYRTQIAAYREHRADRGERGSAVSLLGIALASAVVVTVGWVAADDYRFARDMDAVEEMIAEGDLEGATSLSLRRLEIYPDELASVWNLARISELSGDVEATRQYLDQYLEAIVPGSHPEATAWRAELDAPSGTEEPGEPLPGGAF